MGSISIGLISISKETVDSYEIVDENYKKSATGAVGRAAVGAFLLGPVGLLAGVSAKKQRNSYTCRLF